MLDQPKAVIISGAPGTGKSSILSKIEELGFICHDEIARKVIEQNQMTGINVFPWNKMPEFSDLVFDQMEELSNDIDCFCFLDRSAVDLIAYLRFAGDDVPQRYVDAIKKWPYHKKVFITPVWEEIYENDAQRKEDLDQAMRIDRELRKAYAELGFEVVEVKKSDVNSRVNFILEEIGQKSISS